MASSRNDDDYRRKESSPVDLIRIDVPKQSLIPTIPKKKRTFSDVKRSSVPPLESAKSRTADEGKRKRVRNKDDKIKSSGRGGGSARGVILKDPICTSSPLQAKSSCPTPVEQILQSISKLSDEGADRILEHLSKRKREVNTRASESKLPSLSEAGLDSLLTNRGATAANLPSLSGASLDSIFVLPKENSGNKQNEALGSVFGALQSATNSQQSLIPEKIVQEGCDPQHEQIHKRRTGE